MTIRFASTTEIADWNKHVLANPDGGNIFQGKEFADQKSRTGWKPRFVMAGDEALLLLEKKLPGLGNLWYAPKGPAASSPRDIDEILSDLKEFAHAHGAFMIKLEPEIIKSSEAAADLMKLGLVKSNPVQPNFSTVLLDLSPDLDTVMANLNQKGRHAIRRAERDGVIAKTVKATDENCRVMYDLFALTAAGSFRIRPYEYYREFWQGYEKAGLGQLFFAYYDGQVVAGAYAMAFGKKGTYKDGASVRKRTAYGASHLLQWRVIEWMKKKGVTVHDLCGAPPSDQIKNPDHPHYGIGRFKTSFNKEVTDYVGGYDIVIKPRAYRIWSSIGERLILRFYRQILHGFFY